VRFDKEKKRWVVSAYERPQPDETRPTSNLDSIVTETIVSATDAQLGIRISRPQSIKWVAFGVNRKSCHTALVGEVVDSRTESQIRECFERLETAHTELDFVPITPAAVLEFLRTRQCSDFLRLGLHLLLLRRFPEEVKIVRS